MSLSIGGASSNGADLTFPGVDHDEITLGVELELAIFNLNDDNRNHSLWFSYIRGSLIDIERKLSKPGNRVIFTVKDDASINIWWKGPGSKVGVAVEVATPILLGDQFEWVIPEMCAAINDAVKRQGAIIDLSPESECGLHVHIGIQERHYTLGELKRIAKAVIIFEDVMEIHHAAHRRGSADYIRSNRAAEQLRGLSIVQMVSKLESATTTNELLHMINSDPNSPDKHFKYNLTATKKFGTVEFRQAEGSIDDTKILEWIRNVITFIIGALYTPDERFLEFAYWADQGLVWDEDISAYYGLPPPDRQVSPAGIDQASQSDDGSDEEPAESDDILPDLAELTLDSGGAEGPVAMRKRDALRMLKGRVSAKIHSHHIRERMTEKMHRKHIRERLSNRIQRTLAKISKRRAA
ncbi:putative amidoligase enzyme-domain-containing protein [Morchella snyderi]|nr:putative amidoligase enzyme-domain-containing protein [Morchella snyderi]